MTKRKGFVIGLIVVMVVGQGGAAGAAWYLRHDARGQLTAAMARNIELQQQADRAMPAPVVETKQEPKQLRLPETNDVTGTMQLLEGLCDAAGVSVDALKAMPSNTPGKQPFQVAVRGAPQQVCALLATIEQHERMLVIESGRVITGGADALVVEFAVATWHLGGAK